MAKSFLRLTCLTSLAMVLVLIVAEPALALGHSVTGRREWRSGPAKMAELSGTFRLAAGERIVSVQIEHLDANFRVVSSAAGEFDTTRRTWKAASGDFRTVHYRVVFYMRRANGTALPEVKGTLYRWTGSAR